MKLYILQYKNGTIGKLFYIDTHMYTSVKSVKKLIKKLYGIPVYKQCIYFNDILLDNKFLLRDYSIKRDCTLYLSTHTFFTFLKSLV